MLNNPGNSSASSRLHYHYVNLVDHQANFSRLSMKTHMHGAEAEEGAVAVEGVGVEVAMVVMVDMETTKVATTKVVGIMIIKADMAVMIIKVGMVVDMATTKADMEAIKKMMDITEDEVVCEEEAIGVTVEAMKEAGVAMKEAGVVVLLVEGDMVAVEGGEWVAAVEGTECKQASGVSFNACFIIIRGKR